MIFTILCYIIGSYFYDKEIKEKKTHSPSYLAGGLIIGLFIDILWFIFSHP